MKYTTPLLLLFSFATAPLLHAANTTARSAAWEQDNHEKTRYTIRESITQSEFESFCAAHPDAERLEIRMNKSITSLTPLSKLTKLQKLTLFRLSEGDKFGRNRPRFDLSPLAGLTDLTDLDCSNTLVSRVASLKGLTKLKNLKLYESEVQEPLNGLPESIENLDLHGRQKFPDYAPLAKLKLKSIDVYMNPQATPDNLAALRGMQSLEVFGAALSKTVTDIGFLADCPKLKEVDLWNDPVADFNPLSGKPELTKLGLAGTKLKSLAPFAACTKLQNVNFSDTEINDITLLENNPDLSSVILGNTGVKSIAALAGKPKLQRVDIVGTAVNDLSPLFENEKLSILRVPPGIPAEQIEKLKAKNQFLRVEIIASKEKKSGTPTVVKQPRLQISSSISDAEFAERCKKNPDTTDVWVQSGTKGIRSLAPLAGLMHLEQLTVQYQIHGEKSRPSFDLTPLAGLTKLKRLELDCAVKNQSALKNLTALEFVILGMDEETSIDFIKGLPALKRLALKECKKPLADLSCLKSAKNLGSIHIGGAFPPRDGNTEQQLTVLAELPALTDISLSWNSKITSLNFLSKATKLTRISFMGCNNLKDISAVKNFHDLEDATLWCDNIKDVSPLKTAEKLQYVNLPHDISKSQLDALKSARPKARISGN